MQNFWRLDLNDTPFLNQNVKLFQIEFKTL